MTSFPLWAAIRTVKSRIGTWAGYDIYASADPSITRADWARNIGQARAALANRVLEATRPLNRRPSGPNEIHPYEAPRARGFMQYVDVYVKPAHGGPAEARPWAIRTDTLMSRRKAINLALSRFEAATLPDGTFEGEVVLDAGYAGTFEFVPIP
jgi:hypothetical protein